MSEKVRFQFQVTEDEDGIHIQIKGDKAELLRTIFDHRRMPFGRRWEHHRGRHPFSHRGPFGWHCQPEAEQADEHEHGRHGQPEAEPGSEHKRGHHFGRRGHGGHGRRGYDLGPWWDADTDAPITNA